LGMTRTYGRAAPSERGVEATPDYSGPHYTEVATISLAGVAAPWIFAGATLAPRAEQVRVNGTFFATYPQHALAPSLQPDDIVLIDNLSAHKSAEAQACLEACGVRVVNLPPYSSDYNPIELPKVG